MVRILTPFFLLSVLSSTCLSLSLPVKRDFSLVEDYEVKIDANANVFNEAAKAFGGTKQEANVSCESQNLVHDYGSLFFSILSPIVIFRTLGRLPMTH